MLTLVVRVPDGSNRTAMATLRDGPRTVLKDFAVAVPLAGLGQQHGNPTGDPLRPFGPVPRGDYSLVALAPTPAEAVGTALTCSPSSPSRVPPRPSRSAGSCCSPTRASGRELQLRRTQGGLRLTVAMVNAIVSRLAADGDLHLRVEPLSLTPPPWWAFWRPRPENVRPLSAEPPRLLAPPLDEATLAGHALRTGRRRRLRRYDPGTDTWRDPTPTTGGSTSASDTRPEGEQGTPLQSGSGRFGGAGATGAGTLIRHGRPASQRGPHPGAVAAAAPRRPPPSV
jgi:hypothetical protein